MSCPPEAISAYARGRASYQSTDHRAAGGGAAASSNVLPEASARHTGPQPQQQCTSTSTRFLHADDDLTSDFGYIVFVSNSPETKKGMFPPIMTLIDYDIESVGKYTCAAVVD